MRRSLMLAFVALALTPAALYAATPSAKPKMQSPARAIAAAVADPRRDAAFRLRDKYRHPAQTLAFFGVRPNHIVVEVWPGTGWYMEILAPLLRDNGSYIAAAPPTGRGRTAVETKIASDPARFDKVTISTLEPGKASDIAPEGTADVVLTFRNVHNFLMTGDDVTARAFQDFFRALKPGGVLGVVDHRLPEDRDSALERSSGYVKRSTIIRIAEAVGFKLVGEAKINANPRDTADWPKGVWTLPPTLALGDVERERYLAIGESDRLTLKFVKPAG
jgi:predicted methyltransferase